MHKLNKMIALSAGLAMWPVATPASTQAVPAITTDSAVYVERTATDARRRLEPATRLSPGDRVITVVRWYRMGGAGGFVVTNPLPRTLAYQGSAQDGQEVSVDGGKTWGRLDNMRVGNREAVPDDVTHVRWRFPANATMRGRGQIAYAGIVR